METLKIGQILTDADTQRDAIHIAVLPVVAAKTLEPGWHVGLLPDGTASELAEPLIGIVDPFIDNTTHGVRKGQRFYIFMYPNTITGLRHNWTHPAVPDEKPATPKGSGWPMAREEDTEARRYSEKWIENYARHTLKISYDDMLRITHEYLSQGEWFNTGSNEPSLPSEYWDHFKRVTGIDVPKDDRQEFFTCAC